jgi:CRP-like cAMP-binding protein
VVRVPEGVAVLGSVPLFARLPSAALDELSGRLRRRRYRRGEAVFFQGEPGSSLCIVREGRIKLGLTSPEGREIILDLFGPGDAFGELGLFDGEPRSADAIAVEPSELLLLEREEFLGVVLRRPELAIELLSTLARRLRRDAQLLQDAAFQDVPARLARTILRLAEAPVPGEPAITPRLTQTDLAGMVGTTRETLNKWLAFYQEQGAISWHKGRVTVLRPERLRQRIQS